MSTDPRLPGPLTWALAGTGVAVLGLIVPQWYFGAAAATVSDDVPLIAIVLVSLYGQSSLVGASQSVRLRLALLLATLQACIVGGAAYWLYAIGQPQLLMGRYTRHLAAASPQQAEQLKQHADHWLSPAAQAIDLGETLLVASFLISGFVAFRARVARRRAQGR